MPFTADRVRTEMLTLDLRPVRLVYLVRLDRPETVERAMRAASTLWGGLRSPIVSVSPDGDVAASDAELIRICGGDAVVNMTRVEDEAPIWPARPLEGLQIREPDEHYQWPASPLIFPDAYPNRYRTSGRILERHLGVSVHEDALRTEVVGGVPRLWALAALGGVYNTEDLAALATYGVVTSPPVGPAETVLGQISGLSMLASSALHDVDEDIEPSGTLLASAADITVMPSLGDDRMTDTTVGAGPIKWWNARALRPALHDRTQALSIVLPLDALDDQRVPDAIGRIVNELTLCSPAVFLRAGPGTRVEDVHAVAERLPFESFSGTFADHRTRPADWRPTLYTGHDPSTRWRVRRSAGLRSTSPAVITSTGSMVRYVPSVAVAASHSGPVVIRVTSPSMLGPIRRRVAERHLKHGRWDGFGIATTIPDLTSPDLILYEPEPDELLHACFTDEWEPPPYRLSDKGRQVNGLLERVRAANVDERLLCRRAMWAIASALTEPPDRDLIRVVDRLVSQRDLADQDVLDVVSKAARSRPSTFLDLFSNPDVRGTISSREELAEILADMCRSELLDMTLAVVCGACGLRDHLRVDAAPPIPPCPGCGLPARYVYHHTSPPIVYRPSTLLTLAFTNGSLIPAAAAVRLSGQRAFVLPGVDLHVPIREPARPLPEVPRDNVLDIDLLGWRFRQLFVGEAKTSAAAFDEQTLQSAVTTAAHVGADVLLLVAPQHLDAYQIEVARTHADPDGINVETMTGRQLFE